MNIALIVMLPVCLILVALIVLFAVMQGIKWGIALKLPEVTGQIPEIKLDLPEREEPNPALESILQNRDILDEWLNGPKPEKKG